MSIKLLSIFAAGLGLAICTVSAQAAGSPFDYDSPIAARRASATEDEPPVADDSVLPELKKPVASAKKPNTTKPDATTEKTKSKSDKDRGTTSDIGGAPKVLPPNVKARPAYGGNSANWPQSAAPGAAQKAGANFSADGLPYGARGNTSSYSSAAPTASANRAGQIQRPSQQFAQSSPPSYDYRTNSRMASVSQPSNSSSSMSPESIVAGSPMNSGSAMQAWDEGAPCNSSESCNRCDSCCYNCINVCGNCGWFAGVDYLLLRPSFSEEEAYLKRVTNTSPDEVVTTTDTVVHQDFGYNSGTRAFFGYRCSCNEEIRFTYWNYGASSTQQTGVATADGSVLYAGHLELNTTPGQRINTEAGLRANLYDIEYSKCCCNPCNSCGGCCPPWTLKYTAGIRIAEIGRHDDDFLIDVDGSDARQALISANFIGAGPRVGIEGRRFFGGGRVSLFARTNLSLLLGEFSIDETRLTPGGSPTLIEHYFDSHDRIIPVAEIELGGTWQMTQRMTLSAGYLFQAWWDLGAFEQIEGNVFLNPIDDSNIMAFDGLFARLEYCF